MKHQFNCCDLLVAVWLTLFKKFEISKKPSVCKSMTYDNLLSSLVIWLYNFYLFQCTFQNLNNRSTSPSNFAASINRQEKIASHCFLLKIISSFACVVSSAHLSLIFLPPPLTSSLLIFYTVVEVVKNRIIPQK